MKCIKITIVLVVIGAQGFCQFEDFSEEQKLVEFEKQKETLTERLNELTRDTSPELRAIGDEMYAYNRGRSENLALSEKAMSPDGDITLQIYPVSGLKLDDRTFPMFDELLRYSTDSEIRSKVIWRFRKEYLSGKFQMPKATQAYLGELMESEVESERYGSNLYTAASMLLQDIESGEYEWHFQAEASNPPAMLGSNGDVGERDRIAIKPEPGRTENTLPEEIDPDESRREPIDQWKIILVLVLFVIGLSFLIVKRNSKNSKSPRK